MPEPIRSDTSLPEGIEQPQQRQAAEHPPASDEAAAPASDNGMGPWSDWRKAEGRFSGISPQRWQELLRHYAEIQQYQKAHGLQDRGDPLE